MPQGCKLAGNHTIYNTMSGCERPVIHPPPLPDLASGAATLLQKVESQSTMEHFAPRHSTGTASAGRLGLLGAREAEPEQGEAP